MLMDYMKEIKEISAEQAIILWQASRLSLSKIYEKAPEILKVISVPLKWDELNN